MVNIRQFAQSDFDRVKQIYQQGIDTGQATFETKAKDWDQWNSAMLEICRFVAVEGDTVLGWASLSPASSRAVYSGITELSIYVAPEAQGKGVGHALLSKLVEASEANDIWMIQASIFAQNISSVELLTKNGFRILGIRERPAQMNGVWRSTMIMERRSKVVGV
jgi:L-amino acid N-acyltransferase YncA